MARKSSKFHQNKQTPSSKPSISDAQLLKKARRLFLLADSKHQVALKRIRKLCDNHSNSGILFGAQAQILYICYKKKGSDKNMKKCMRNALKCARESVILSPNSLVFSAFLAYLLYKSEDYMDAFEVLNTALNISNPTDPKVESPQASFCKTYKERIDDVRNGILKHLERCVSMLKSKGDDGSSIIKLELQSLNVEKKEKVKLYWISLSTNEKQNFLQVDVNDLKSSLVSSEKYTEEKILSEALSFFEAHKKWEFFKCCSCDAIFPHPSLHFIHIATNHLEEILSQLIQTNAVRVSDWVPIINTREWEPLDTSAASTMLEKRRELLSSKGNKTNIQETSTSELLKTKCEMDRDIYNWDWKLSSDSNCMKLLSRIQEKLKELLSERLLLATHMDILTQRAMSKFDGHFGGLLREFRVNRTHHCLCFLDASQLKEIHQLLQEMHIFTASVSTAATDYTNENVRIIEDFSCAFEINGEISLSHDSSHLLLDKNSFCDGSISGGSCKTNDYTNDSASARSDSLNVDNLIPWIYSDHSSDQHLEKWISLRAENAHCGKEELVCYKNFLSESLRNLHEFQEGVSLAVIPTDISDLQGCKDTGFALQKPQLDPSIQATIHKKSENNDSELSKSDKQILQFAVDVHQLETIVNSSAAYSYQPIVLSIVKQYIQECLEDIMDKEPTKETDTSIAKDMGTEEMRHALEMKESAGASIVKDLGTEEVRNPLEMEESIGASIGKDLGTEEVNHPLERKESIGFLCCGVSCALALALLLLFCCCCCFLGFSSH